MESNAATAAAAAAAARLAAPRVPLARRVLTAARGELFGLDLRLSLCALVAGVLPAPAFSRTRAALYRLGGLRLGPATLVAGPLQAVGAAGAAGRFVTGPRCFLNGPLYVSLEAEVRLGADVSVGHHVVFVTADHELGSPWRRAGEVQASSIEVGDGAWIAASVTVLPGARIGAGAVVAAGSLVRGEIPPHTLVAGVPARVIRQLGDDEVVPTPAQFLR